MWVPFAKRFRSMAANATGLVGSRLSLFSTELQCELARRARHLVLLLAVFLFAALALLSVSALILALAWQHGHLPGAAACLTLVYVIGALVCAYCLHQGVRGSPEAFAGTLAELRRDETSLRSKDAQDSTGDSLSQ